MDFTQVLTQFLTDPNTGYRTGLRFVHFIGLAMGLGGATLLDLMLLRFFVRGRITDDTYDVFAFASRIVDIGLRLLWITGIGFLFLYALTQPDLLTNPKVHAKLAIVAILTLNGFFIHQIILPNVKRQVGRSLFTGVSTLRRTIFVTSGAISVVSWYVPVALGAFPQLNFQVSALTLLAGYFALIACAAVGMHMLILLLHPSTPVQDTPDVDAGDDPSVQQFRRRILTAPPQAGHTGRSKEDRIAAAPPRLIRRVPS